ncbi:MAG: 1-acyl-sn-glycerol-3-phosphate acyltransferase [Anaerolineae bacterium]|nr:1-acyl-sn-glycerol-3-phosphate acyltransferase [Anaerolineae bacterium]
MKPKRYLLGRVVVFFVRVLAHMLMKIKVEGAVNFPKTGPLVMLGNHINFLDPVLPYAIARRYVKGMTAVETYRRFFFNFLAWSVDAIPVERGTPDLSAIRACVEALEAGWALYIAPEGTRSGHGRLQRGYAGVTLILLRAGEGVPIYPMGFAGVEHFWPNIKRLRRTPVCVRIGQPFYLAPPEGRIRQPERDQIMAEIMGQIAALLPPENRGLYADQVGQKPQYLRFEQA